MAIVAGVDFGTLSVRVTLRDTAGTLGTASAEYPLHRRRDDPDFATQSHADHMAALTRAMRDVLAAAKVPGDAVAALAIDTTGSSVVVVGEGMQPLDDYYLWCDHRAKAEAQEITELARRENLEAIQWCGGTYSSEWGFAKLLHWLRHNPEQRGRLVSAFEHCDMAVATLTGITDPARVKRSVCAMGHKWMWNPAWGGLPPQAFLSKVDPLFDGIRDKLAGDYATSDVVAGHLSADWAGRLGLRAGIPLPVGALDAHWDAIGAGCRIGDVVNVVGTSTCIIAMGAEVGLVPGVCGVVPGSVDPRLVGIEAGLAATGDVFSAIAHRAGASVADLSRGLFRYRPGQTGLMRLVWDNGDRTILVRPDLGGITLGWNLTHTAQDELFAAIEGSAFHTRIILDHLAGWGVPIERVINSGGIPQRNALLNQIYADVLGKPVLVPAQDPTGLGSCIVASVAAGLYPTFAAAQAAMSVPYRTFVPNPAAKPTYERLYALYRALYFGFGGVEPTTHLGTVLPELKQIAKASLAAAPAVAPGDAVAM